MAKEVKKFLMVASLAESILNFRSELLSDIQAKGFQIHVGAPSFKNKKHLIKEFSDRNIFVHDIALWRTGLNPFLDLWTIINLWFLMIKIRPDYFMGYTVKPVVYGTIAARCAFVKNRIALITGLGYAFTTSTEGLLVKKLIQNLYRVSLSYATFIFFQNKDDKQLFSELNIVSADQTVFVVNGSGVNLNHYKLCEIPVGQQSFLLFARLLNSKGIREYANAASILHSEYPSIRFLLAGRLEDGPDSISEFDLERWIQSGSIEYLGEVKDIRLAIRDATVVVLPSYREGLPRSILEALSMGRAIITTNVPGCRETVIDGVNGFLIKASCHESLVVAMRRFIGSEGLAHKMGKKSYELAAMKFDVKKVNIAMIEGIGIK